MVRDHNEEDVMYFLLDEAVIDSSGDMLHPAHSMVNVVEALEDYMRYGVDTFKCLYGEVGMQVTVVQSGDLAFGIIGRTADENMDTIFAMEYHY
jgi:hypothetical protein